MKETITHNWGRSHIYPRMTRSEVDWFMGKRFFWGVEVMKVVGREQVGWSPLIQDDMYVAVVEYQDGSRHLRDLSQLVNEVPLRYAKFREIMLAMAVSESEEW